MGGFLDDMNLIDGNRLELGARTENDNKRYFHTSSDHLS